MENRKIRVAITHGDTNGIGYELIFKTFAEPEMLELCTPIIYGSPKIAAYHRKALDLQATFSIINDAGEAKDGRVNMLACFDEDVKVELGVQTTESGTAAVKALDKALADYKDGLFDVLVCCPEDCKGLDVAGFKFEGLKNYIETSLGEGRQSVRMLLGESMRMAFATDGLAIKDVAGSITKECISYKTKLLADCIRRDFTISGPRIGVLGLNPGADGKEENDIIKPALEDGNDADTTVFGPYPAEAYFSQRMYDAFDCTLAMYDDQGTIPFNALSCEPGVMFFAGLPIVCTTLPDGPCFDIAGKCVADPSGLRRCIFTAIDVFRNRNAYDEPLSNPLQKLYHEKRDESDKVRFAVPKKRDAVNKAKPQPKEDASDK